MIIVQVFANYTVLALEEVLISMCWSSRVITLLLLFFTETAVKLFFTKDMLLLSLCFAYTGELAFSAKKERLYSQTSIIRTPWN